MSDLIIRNNKDFWRTGTDPELLAEISRLREQIYALEKRNCYLEERIAMYKRMLED